MSYLRRHTELQIMFFETVTQHMFPPYSDSFVFTINKIHFYKNVYTNKSLLFMAEAWLDCVINICDGRLQETTFW